MPSSYQFAVTVTTNDVDCAGQFVVTALAAPPAPPSMLARNLTYVIGPSSSNNSVIGMPLTTGAGPLEEKNDWKISATCNGQEIGQIGYKSLEFFSK